MNTIAVEWEIKTLDELTERIDYGHTASADSAVVGPKFLRITDIQNGHVDWSNVPYCPATPGELNKYRLSEGDIVFARTGNTTGKSFLIKHPPKDSVFASYLIRVRPKRSVDPRFLAHFFDTPNYWNQIEKNTQGAGQPGVNATRLKTLEVPLPPLSEQKRIADILDKADVIRRKRQTAIDLLLQIPGSAFHAMFGTPAHNANGWKIGTIRDLVTDVKYGSSSKASAVGKYPMLRMNNITYEGTWNLSDLKYIDLDTKDLPKYLVSKGDILFNRTNSKDLVGKTAVFQEDVPMAFAGYLVRARTNKLAHPDYISGYLNSPHGKATLRHKCKNIVGMANINAQEFQDILIPKPPIEAQLEYVQILDGVRKSEKRLGTVLIESESLFDSLVQRAFLGKL